MELPLLQLHLYYRVMMKFDRNNERNLCLKQ
jgi:hypothetical protein